MDKTITLMILLAILGAGALFGFFRTKTQGFGKYNTCTLVLVVVFTLCALLFSAGVMQGELFGHVAMAVIGFAGGLVVAQEK